ncbi:hypothetical protein MYX07_02145 [Patescibacteria group bacterium AH-259-L07]|nr:hypothetical protein [Patescibacteria group bacterium AH-259-L07]
MSTKKPKLIVIDAPAVLYRGWYALPKIKDPKGRTINAVYGFTALLLKLLREQKPDYIAAAFDTPAPTFRHKKYKKYKATRVPQPQEFYDQIPITKQVIESFNIPVFSKDGFEADDLIATLVTNQKSKIKNLTSLIVTGDLDLLQLVDHHTNVYFLKQGVKNIKIYDTDAVYKRFDLPPNSLIDFKALAGDPSDNIPGAPGIGLKTATDLIKKFKTIENIYKYIEKPGDKTPKESKLPTGQVKESVVQTLIKRKKDVLLAKELITLKNDVKGSSLGSHDHIKLDIEKITRLFNTLGFKSLLKRLEQINAGEQNKLF